MRLNKKLAATALAALMASSVLAGCGDSSTEATGAGNATEAEGATEAGSAADEGGESTSGEMPTITMVAVDHSGNALNNDRSDEVVQQLEDYMGMHIEFQWESNSTYSERFGTILMDKENMPMILTSADNTVKSTVVEAAKRDAFWDLTEYLKDEEAYPNLSQMTDEVKDALTVDGKVIGLPRQRPVGRYGVSYRADWAEKVGITEAPETIDDMYDMIYKFAKEDPDGNGQDDTYGMEMTKYTGPFDIIQTWFGVGNKWVEQDGKLVPVHQTEEYMEALNWMRGLVEEGLVRKDFAAVDTATWGDGIKKGEAGVFIDVLDTGKRTAQYFDTNNIASVVNPDEKASIAYVGAIKKDDSSEPKTLSTGGYAGFFLITKDGAKTEEDLKNCLTFLDKMGDNDMRILSDYGLEGFQWEENEDGMLEQIQTGLEAAQTPNNGLNQAQCYLPYNVTLDPEPVKDDFTKEMEAVQLANEEFAVANPATKYLVNSETAASRSTTLDQLLDDARTQYISGVIDEAGLQSLWAQWAEQGGNDLVNEINELYQADTSK